MELDNYLKSEILQCNICMDGFNSSDRIARRLPCNHICCERCIKGKQVESTAVCPKCSSCHQIPHGQLSEFPKDETICRLQNYLDCGSDENRARKRKDSERNIGCKHCNQSANTATKSCEKCDVPLCENCSIRHERKQKHIIRPLEETIEQYRAKIKKRIGDAQCITTELHKREQEMNKVREKLSEENENTIKEINESFTRMKQKLEVEQERLEDGVSVSTRKIEAKIDGTLHKIRDEISSRENACVTAENLDNLEGQTFWSSLTQTAKMLDKMDNTVLLSDPIEYHAIHIDAGVIEQEVTNICRKPERVNVKSISSWKTDIKMFNAHERKMSSVAEIRMTDIQGKIVSCSKESIEAKITDVRSRTYPADRIDVGKEEGKFYVNFTPKIEGKHSLMLAIGNTTFEREFDVPQDPFARRIGQIYCPPFTVNKQTVHESIRISEDGSSLIRLPCFKSHGDQQLKVYKGGIGTASFDMDDTELTYYQLEVDVQLNSEFERKHLLFETGLCPKKHVDEHDFVAFRPFSVSFSVTYCMIHDKLCWRTTTSLISCGHGALSTCETEQTTKKFGFLLDPKRRRWSVFDLHEKKLLSEVTECRKEDLWPVFGIPLPADQGRIKLNLITGTQVETEDITFVEQFEKDRKYDDDGDKKNQEGKEKSFRKVDNTAVSAASNTTISGLTSTSSSTQTPFDQETWKTIDIKKEDEQHLSQVMSLTNIKREIPRHLLEVEDRFEIKTVIAREYPCISDSLENLLETCLRMQLSLQASVILEHICDIIKAQEGTNCIDVFAAYTKNKWDPSFVLLEEKVGPTREEKFHSWKLVRRRYDLVSPEAAKVMNSGNRSGNQMKVSDMEKVRKVLSRSNLTTSHSKITLINACNFRSKEGGTRTIPGICIVIHCLLKGYIPFDEEPFPSDIESIPVDIREGFCIFGMLQPQPSDVEMPNSGQNQPTDVEMPNSGQNRPVFESTASTHYNKKLLMGGSIGPSNGGTRGTLGGFVRIYDGSIGLLTCAHVVRDARDVSQPADDDVRHCTGLSTSYKCGELVDKVFEPGDESSVGVDAAVFKITEPNRLPEEGTFVDIRESQLKSAGFDLKDKPAFTKGKTLNVRELPKEDLFQTVIKVGSETGLTRGAITFDGSYAKQVTEDLKLPNGEYVKFFNQLEVAPIGADRSGQFFNLGDSGALIFMVKEKELCCIGLAVGFTSYFYCLMTPIEEVLKKLNVTFVDFSRMNKKVETGRPDNGKRKRKTRNLIQQPKKMKISDAQGDDRNNDKQHPNQNATFLDNQFQNVHTCTEQSIEDVSDEMHGNMVVDKEWKHPGQATFHNDMGTDSILSGKDALLRMQVDEDEI